MPGKTVGWVWGEESPELLGVDAREEDGDEGDLYILFNGGSLYWISPVTSDGYNEPGLDSGVVAAALRWSASGSLVSMGGGP
jgi:hypothetical protein